jgi:hypothetical protein
MHNVMNKKLLPFILIAMTCTALAQGTSEEAISNYSTPITGSYDGTAGWTFKPLGGVVITHLGAFTNVVVEQGPISVGVWGSDGTLLRSNTVTAVGQLVNRSYYSPIEPLWLIPQETYHVGIFSPSGRLFLSFYDPLVGGSLSVSTRIQLGGYAEGPNGFVFPAAVPDGQGAVWIGANFLAVPEPGALSLLALAMAVGSFARRFRKPN